MHRAGVCWFTFRSVFLSDDDSDDCVISPTQNMNKLNGSVYATGAVNVECEVHFVCQQYPKCSCGNRMKANRTRDSDVAVARMSIRNRVICWQIVNDLVGWCTSALIAYVL